MPARIAVIDIGSNTIKLLVAEETESGEIADVFKSTLETRLGQGLNGRRPAFSADLIARAGDAVQQLVREAREFSPEAIRIVATSAVRDAGNSADFTGEIRRRTGIELEILSGEREAELIGAAVRNDPQIGARDFYVFDLGGGSLEALAFRDRELQEMTSLQLGCVRLSERCVTNPKAPFTPEDEARVADAIASGFSSSGFSFPLPPGAIAVGTGGTLTLSLSILAAREGKTLNDRPLFLSREELRELLDLIGSKTFSERLEIPQLSSGRADVFPAALTTFLKLTDLAGLPGIHHSLFNLRYGLARKMLLNLDKQKAAKERQPAC